MDQNCVDKNIDQILNDFKQYMAGDETSEGVIKYNMSKSDMNGDVEMFFVALISCPSLLEVLESTLRIRT